MRPFKVTAGAAAVPTAATAAPKLGGAMARPVASQHCPYDWLGTTTLRVAPHYRKA